MISQRRNLNGAGVAPIVAATLAVLMLAALMLTPWSPPARADDAGETTFKRIPTQFIAALGDPQATAGSGAEAWGLWRVDPGPRGVWLNKYEDLKAAGGVAPAKWRFDEADWWVEEHGLIMEQPEFPLAPGKYVVTGDRTTVSVLTVFRAGADGAQRWELADGATLYDVTHLRCRSGRYTPAAGGQSCSPAAAQMSSFPVSPGAAMPPVAGCAKRDYAVLFMIGIAADQ